jgi:centrosomal protein CEP164
MYDHNDNSELNESVLLEEEIDDNYEPTEEDIIEYAKFLGMDIEKDKQYLFIAKEGLKSPLPYPWKPY